MQLKNLNTSFLGRKIIFLPKVDSMQNEIWRLIEKNKIASGTIVMADIQTAGKGTHGRTWYTDESGNIAFSMYIKTFCNVDALAGVTLAISVQIISVLQEKYGISLDIFLTKVSVYNYNNRNGGDIMSTKKLFKIFITIAILCVCALIYLLMDEDSSMPVGDNKTPQNDSGEIVNPGIEIVLSGDVSGEEVLVESGENIESGEEEIIVSGDEIEAPTESESPEITDDNNTKEPVSSSPSGVKDSFISEVKELSKEDKYKFFEESGKLIFVMGSSQTLVYEYDGEIITSYKKYNIYESAEAAKTMYDVLNAPTGPLMKNVEKVTIDGNIVILDFKKEEYSEYTVQEIKNMYSIFKIEK